MTGCRSKRPLVVVPSAHAEGNVTDGEDFRRSRLIAIKNSVTDFKTMAIRAKANLSIGSMTNDVSMNIRIKNKEAIWVSVTALAGLEVARALITPDSIRIINRMESEYITKPFSYISEFTNEKINFGTLQSVLTGNIIPEFISDSTRISLLGDKVQLTSAVAEVTYDLEVNGQNKVIQAQLNDGSAEQSLSTHYADYQNVENRIIPFSILMKSESRKKNIMLDMKLSKVDIDIPLELPFRVPDRFLIKN
jgi:hypothetical protein